MKPLVYKKAKRVRHKPAVAQKLHIAKGDMVQVISGDEKGKRGKVLHVLTDKGRQAWEDAVAAQAKKEALVASSLSEREKQQLTNLLRKLMLAYEKREREKG